MSDSIIDKKIRIDFKYEDYATITIRFYGTPEEPYWLAHDVVVKALAYSKPNPVYQRAIGHIRKFSFEETGVSSKYPWIDKEGLLAITASSEMYNAQHLYDFLISQLSSSVLSSTTSLQP